MKESLVTILFLDKHINRIHSFQVSQYKICGGEQLIRKT